MTVSSTPDPSTLQVPATVLPTSSPAARPVVRKLVSRGCEASKLSLHPYPPATHIAPSRVLRQPGTPNMRINNLFSEYIFCLHYATEKVLIYNLQHINHPSNFQMLNASLTFMFSSITWLFWGRGANWLLTKSISCGRFKDHKKLAWASISTM
jgi:hypothetical protein